MRKKERRARWHTILRDGEEEENAFLVLSYKSRARVRRREQGKRTRANEREDGEFMEISPFGERDRYARLSPIFVTERLLATFCPRDNSLLFFMAAPISQLENYSQEVSLGIYIPTPVYAWGNVTDTAVVKYRENQVLR